MARTVTSKSDLPRKDQPETRTHVLDEIPEEEEEDRFFRTDCVTRTSKNPKNTSFQRSGNHGKSSYNPHRMVEEVMGTLREIPMEMDQMTE